jgi:hypothetical protein
MDSLTTNLSTLLTFLYTGVHAHEDYEHTVRVSCVIELHRVTQPLTTPPVVISDLW